MEMKKMSSCQLVLEKEEVVFTEEEAVKEASKCLGCKNGACISGCPLHNYIPEVMRLVAGRRFEEAYYLLAKMNPFIQAAGCSCPSQELCEHSCEINICQSAVQIRKIEQFIGAYYEKNELTMDHDLESIDLRVAIVGAGITGLICALSLAESGFIVTVYEKEAEAGGTWFGDHNSGQSVEQENLKTVIEGVSKKAEIVLNTEIDPESGITKLLEINDAVFVAVGTGIEHYNHLTNDRIYIAGGVKNEISSYIYAIADGKEAAAVIFEDLVEDYVIGLYN